MQSISACQSLLNVLKNYLLSSNFSSKYLKTLSKGDVSPFFLNVDGKNQIFHYIYDLLNDGIRGTAKKDAVLTVLADISVSKKKFFLLFPQWLNVFHGHFRECMPSYRL